MGYDAFGLPAENNAIKTGEPPREATERSIASFRRQFREWGISIDWSRELGTHTPEYYRWTQWIFLRLFEHGPRLPDRGAGPVVPEGRHRARQRAGRRRPLRALRHRGRAAQARAVVLPDHRVRRPPARRLRPARVLARARDHDAAQLDRPLRGRRGRLPLRGADLDFPVFTTRPDTLFGATFFVLAPEHPELERLVAGTPAEAEVREYVNRVARESAEERGAEDREKTGVPLGRSVVNPVNGEEIPMFVADYVLMEYGTGAIMAVPGPRHPRLRVRPGLRPAGEPGDRGRGPRGGPRRRGPALPRRRADGRLRPLRRQGQPRGLRGDRRLAGVGGARQARGQLPPARLAGLAPALLGRADPGRLLRGAVRDRPGPRRPAAGRAARGRGLRAAGQEPAGRGRGLGRHRVPALRRPGPPRDRHDGHLRRLLLVLHPLPRPAQRGGGLGPRGGRPLAAGRPVHRRGRARDPAPDVRALLHQGAGRPRRSSTCRSRSPTSSPRG